MKNLQIGLAVKGLEKIYTGGYIGLLKSDFNIDNGIFALYGEAQSGKTTLLRLLAGLEEPSGGDITLDGEKYLDLDIKKRRVALSISDKKAFKGSKSVFYNIAFPLMIRKTEKSTILKKVSYMSKKFGIFDILDYKLKDISDEQFARVVLCRAMIRDCAIYLLDNPLNGLENGLRRALLDTLYQVCQEVKAIVVYATDNLEELCIGTQVGVLYGSKVADSGRLCDLVLKTQHLGVAKILNQYLCVAEVKIDESGSSLSAFGSTGFAKLDLMSDIYKGKSVIAAFSVDSVNLERGIPAKVVSVYHEKDRDILRLQVDSNEVFAKALPYKYNAYDEVRFEVDFSRSLLYDLHSEMLIGRAIEL